MSDMHYHTSEIDPLSQAVSALNPRAVAWRVIEAHDAWTLRFPPVEAVVFGQMLEGRGDIERDDGGGLSLETGDFMLMVAPPTWTLRPPGGGPEVDFLSLIGEPDRLQSDAAAPTVTRFIAGYFVFGAPNAELVADLMPPVVHVRDAEVAAGRLGAVLALLGDEALAARPGRSLILDRLLEIVLVECLRQPEPADAPSRRGLLAGLADPQIGMALRRMHAETDGPRSVARLAREAGMSRSSFSARFAQVVGAPPMDYLTGWRMSLAKAALVASDRPLSEIAERAGYGSVSAFSTAFTRRTGMSPTAFARSRPDR